MEASINYRINFSEPLVSPLSYTWQIRYISYTLGLNPYVLSGTTTAPINSLFSTYFSGNIVTSFNSNGGGIPYQTAGYFELSIVVADTNYRSLLKKYHWGCS